MLANGTGGIAWEHLPLAAAYYGARDIDALMAALITIKLHRPTVPGGGKT